MQPCCSWPCALAWSRRKTVKSIYSKPRRKGKTSELRELWGRKEWLKETERACNAYIRLRDKNLPCISCGTRETVQWEAGHYRSKGAFPELRFNESNINSQCHRCNVHLSGNYISYRIGLVKKIGEAKVAELEGPHPPKKYTVDELKALCDYFKAKTKALKQSQLLPTDDTAF